MILTDTSDDSIDGETDTNFRLQVNYSVDEMINRMQYDYEEKSEEAFWSQYGKGYDGSTYAFKTQLDWKIDDGKWISEQVNAIPAWDRGESAKDNANSQWEYCDLSFFPELKRRKCTFTDERAGGDNPNCICTNPECHCAGNRER